MTQALLIQRTGPSVEPNEELPLHLKTVDWVNTTILSLIKLSWGLKAAAIVLLKID